MCVCGAFIRLKYVVISKKKCIEKFSSCIVVKLNGQLPNYRFMDKYITYAMKRVLRYPGIPF